MAARWYGAWRRDGVGVEQPVGQPLGGVARGQQRGGAGGADGQADQDVQGVVGAGRDAAEPDQQRDPGCGEAPAAAGAQQPDGERGRGGGVDSEERAVTAAGADRVHRPQAPSSSTLLG